MNLSVFNFHGEFPFALISFEKHLDYTQVGEELYNSHRQDLENVKALILRPPVEKPISNFLEERRKCRMLMERFPSLAIYLLGSENFSLFISRNFRSAARFPYDIGDFLEFCRQREMEEFVLQSRSIIKSPDASVFRTPSQEYTNAFLRVGNIQDRRHVLDVIFFWMLPVLKNAGALLTDSWSISSIGLNIGRLYARYLHYIDPGIQEDNFHVNYLSSYYHGKREMGRETRQAFLPLLYANDKKIIFLISAIKTRRSLDILRGEIERQGYLGKMDIIALYALQSGLDVSTLCTLDDPEFLAKARLPGGFASYPAPPQDSSVIVIDERTFMPTVPEVRELALRKELQPESAAFFTRYLGMNAITVHRDACFTNGIVQRHHGLFIDIRALLVHPEFDEELRKSISGLPQKPDFIIYPPHEQGDAFVLRMNELIAERFGARALVCCFADLNGLAPAFRDKISGELVNLGKEALILIADDVLTTGNRLRNYQKFLRELPYKGRIHYLVGVARPPLQADLRTLKRELEYLDGKSTHTFEHIEQVFLPDWNKDSCPWCREAKFLDAIAEEGKIEGSAVLRSLSSRQNMLTSVTRSGLSNEVFHSINNQPKASFAGGSIFCEKPGITEAELVARIAAAVHYFKTVGVEHGRTRIKLGVEYPLYTIIKSRQYLGGTFNEALIKAAILRCCSSQELYAIEDTHLQEQKTMILELMADGKWGEPERCFFIYELFLALSAFKLPTPPMPKDWNAIFAGLLTGMST